MISPRYRVLAPVGILIALGLVICAVVWPDGANRHIQVGLVLGTMFGLTTIASAWNTFGPGQLVVRLPLSLVWTGLILAAFAINVVRNASSLEEVFLLGACLFVLWSLFQFPLWAFALVYGWRLQHRANANEPPAQQRQFGIRQLMIFTAIIATIFGVGRAAVLNFTRQYPSTDEMIIVGFLAVAALVMALPLVLAALLPRWATAAVLLVLTFISVATAFEATLLGRLPIGSLTMEDLIWTNTFLAGWILAFAAALRLTGYSVATREISRPAASAPTR